MNYYNQVFKVGGTCPVTMKMWEVLARIQTTQRNVSITGLPIEQRRIYTAGEQLLVNIDPRCKSYLGTLSTTKAKSYKIQYTKNHWHDRTLFLILTWSSPTDISLLIYKDVDNIRHIATFKQPPIKEVWSKLDSICLACEIGMSSNTSDYISTP